MGRNMRYLLPILALLVCVGCMEAEADIDEFLGASTVDEYLGIATADEMLGVAIAAGAACGHDGDTAIETFEGTGSDLTWTQANSPDTWNVDASNPGTPDAAMCCGSQGVNVADDDADGAYGHTDLGSDVSNSWANDVDYVCYFYINTTDMDTESVLIIQLTSGTEQWRLGALDINLLHDGSTYDLRGYGSGGPTTFAEDIDASDWIGIKVHLDTTAASSTAVYDSDKDGDFSDESPTTITRGTDAPRYFRLGPNDAPMGELETGDNVDLTFGYCTVDTP